MKTSSLILGATAVFGVTAAIFIFSRPAAARDKARKAFTVDMDCGSILVLDEELAKGAFVAAAIAVAPTPDSSAIEALKAICSFMFPQCDWTNPPDGRTFVRGNGQHITWGDLKSAVGERTVADVKSIVEKFSGMQGAASPLPWPFAWGFGTGGCLSCGTGGRRTTYIPVYDPKLTYGTGRR
jgi:hypothetical protein